MNPILLEEIYSLSLYIAGAFMYVLWGVSSINAEFPDKEPGEVFKIYMKRSWVSLMKQLVVMFIMAIVVLLYETYKSNAADSLEAAGFTQQQFDLWGKYATALGLGFSGQFIFYKRIKQIAKKLSGDDFESESKV